MSSSSSALDGNNMLNTSRTDTVLTPSSVFNNGLFTPRYVFIDLSSLFPDPFQFVDQEVYFYFSPHAAHLSNCNLFPRQAHEGRKILMYQVTPRGGYNTINSSKRSARYKRNQFLSYGNSSQSLELSPDGTTGGVGGGAENEGEQVYREQVEPHHFRDYSQLSPIDDHGD